MGGGNNDKCQRLGVVVELDIASRLVCVDSRSRGRVYV